MNATIQKVISDFDSYVSNWARRRDDIPYEIKTAIVAQIIRTGSIDTGRFIKAVDFREDALSENGFRYLIDASRDSEVTYDGFLERGTENYNAYGIKFSPRHNYKNGIENARIEPIADSIADMSFAR